MKYFIAGGAGFIGSHMAKFLLNLLKTQKVTIYDNFSSGDEKNLKDYLKEKKLSIVHADIADFKRLEIEMKGHDVVYHFASNPDISRAVNEPDIDFWQGTYLTQNIVEAVRRCNIPKIIYASGSGVYGETGEVSVFENMGPLLPISTYGASKLAGEALLCAYSNLFNISAIAFRFANVVGGFQTHGVGYDFLRRLKQNPKYLKILGDGSQSKSYIHVEDIISGIQLAQEKSSGNYNVYNLATQDYLTVNEIAKMAIEILELDDVTFEYTGGDRGWKGDVPVVRFNTDLIRSLGWKPQRTSKEAMGDSLLKMKHELEK